MSNAPEEQDGKVGISGRNISNLWFADDIDAQDQELEDLVESVDRPAKGMRRRLVLIRPN